MERLFPQEVDLRALSPLTLAFVGDGVYELMAREALVCRANRPNGDLHRLSVALVRAEAQSAAMDLLLPLLSEEELAVFKRGRNAHTARAGGDYHRATGLEALFGYLYLSGNIARCRELFSVAYGGGRTEDDGKKGR
ncbi:MAG TPA: ribonuclease III [Firmicutes bacterium]|nr:ribonuclease III [Bacillota bacterium]